jgi:peptidoglycan hydrolase-like protein with peptidoglycan-binding domain
LRKVAALIVLVCLPALADAADPGTQRASAARSGSKKIASSSPKKKTVRKKSRSRAARRPAKTWRNRQLKPTRERYAEIQQALIHKGYLQAPATGDWGPESVAAMRRFQQDQKLEPDGKLTALSLIALGLGPRRETPREREEPKP